MDAIPIARRLRPELRFLVVTGPRIDPASLPRRRGATVRGFVPDLYLTLAACDVAVVQGGLTTCMELAAARRPFLYVPLENHFEQNFHVRRRLDNYGAGRCIRYTEASDPQRLADALVAEVGRDGELPPGGDGRCRARGRDAGGADLMRALEPMQSGFVDRDGVAIHYEVYGDGSPTVYLLMPDTIVESRGWKAQIPFLARSFRVVVSDPRGNGGSEAPDDSRGIRRSPDDR